MPRPALIAGQARWAIEGSAGPTKWALTFHTTQEDDGSVTFADATALANTILQDFNEDVVNNGSDQFGAGYYLERIKGTLVDSLDNVWRPLATIVAGGAAGTTLVEGNACALINGVVSDPRRGGKSRMYLAGINESVMLDSSNLDPSAQSDMTAALNAWHNDVNAYAVAPFSNVHLVEMSYTDGGAFRAVPVGYEIFAFACNGVIGTQRRRVDRIRH